MLIWLHFKSNTASSNVAHPNQLKIKFNKSVTFYYCIWITILVLYNYRCLLKKAKNFFLKFVISKPKYKYKNILPKEIFVHPAFKYPQLDINENIKLWRIFLSIPEDFRLNYIFQHFEDKIWLFFKKRTIES